MTLKEILQERKRAQNATANAVEAQTDNQETEQAPTYVFSTPMNEFQALFKDCTDF